jgi:protein-disulfide isomerase
MSKQFLGVLAAIIIVLGGIFVISNHHSQSSGASSSASGSASNTPTNHVEGDLSSKVTLLEYGDYQCPACEEFYPTVKAVEAKYNATIKFQFRNLPLTQLHPNAFAGARAAEAAGLQNKYFEMHDALYDDQAAWDTSSTPLTAFDQFATQLGLNVTKFNSDFASSTVNNAINADLAAFSKTGAEMATPTFFLNGVQLTNTNLIDSSDEPSITAFSTYIDAALKKADS